MFYYCEKCAHIENIKNANSSDIKCPACEQEMKVVPNEYLMPNGNFFKSPNGRNDLIEFIKNGQNYDSDISEQKDSIIAQKNAEEKARIEQRNEELQAEEEEIFSLECPICHKKSISRISTVGKVAKVYAFGVFGVGDLGKKYRCNICGAKF